MNLRVGKKNFLLYNLYAGLRNYGKIPAGIFLCKGTDVMGNKKNKNKKNVSANNDSSKYEYGRSRKITLVAKILIFLLAIALVLTMGFAGGLTLSSGMESKDTIPGITDIQNTGEVPEISAGAAYLIDAGTGQVLFDKNGYQSMFPASTTKIITGYLALKNLDSESTVTIGKEAASSSGSVIELKEGEEMTVKDLVYGLLLFSGNDAAVALATAVSGSVSDFADLMNKTAAEAGAVGTHFENPNGLPDQKHYTTAHDLACIAKMAMSDPAFAEIAGTVEYTIPATNMSEPRLLSNSNRMLWDTKPRYEVNGQISTPNYYAGTIGVKTGHTNEAGYCLVSAVKKSGHTLIGVTMGSDFDNQFLDMIKIMDYGFNNFKSVPIARAADTTYTIKVKHSESRKIGAELSKDVAVVIPASAKDPEITTEAKLEKKYEAPLKPGEKVGTYEVFLNGTLYTTVDIVASDEAVFKKGPDLQQIFTIIIIVLVGLLILLFIIRFIIKANNRRKRRIRQAAREERLKAEQARRREEAYRAEMYRRQREEEQYRESNFDGRYRDRDRFYDDRYYDNKY